MFSLQGLAVKRSQDGHTMFVALPRELWRECGHCYCPVCIERKATVSYWDTLAIANGSTWTVHYPELHANVPPTPTRVICDQPLCLSTVTTDSKYCGYHTTQRAIVEMRGMQAPYQGEPGLEESKGDSIGQ